jgi:hypothetical protein
MKKYSDLLNLVQILNAFSQQEETTKSLMKLRKFADLIKPYLDEFNAVSYTHLRAHETG